MATYYYYTGPDGHVTNKKATCKKVSDNTFDLTVTATCKGSYWTSSISHYEDWGIQVALMFNNTPLKVGISYSYKGNTSEDIIFTNIDKLYKTNSAGTSHQYQINGTELGSYDFNDRGSQGNPPSVSTRLSNTSVYIQGSGGAVDSARFKYARTACNKPPRNNGGGSTNFNLSTTFRFQFSYADLPISSLTGLYVFGYNTSDYTDSGDATPTHYQVFNDYLNAYSVFDNAMNPKDSGNVLKRTGTGRNNIAWKNGNIVSGDKVLQRTGTGRTNIRWLTVSKGTTFNILERTGTSRNNISYKSHWA